MFKLKQHSINQVIAKFQVLNQAGETIGSINVPSNQVEVLLKQWSGPVDRPSSRMAVPTMQLAKAKPMSRAAILRGCL